jgi:hypothetical protein
MKKESLVIKKILVAVGAAAIVAVGGSQIHPFWTPAGSGNGQPILPGAQIDPETLAIVQRACQNCHSEKTEWPWYGHVAPVSWLLARDVQQARSHMNLSRWQDYSSDDRLRLLSEMGSAVRNREMPVQRYLLLHPEARLTNMDRQQIYRWTRTERSRLSPAGASPSRNNLHSPIRPQLRVSSRRPPAAAVVVLHGAAPRPAQRGAEIARLFFVVDKIPKQETRLSQARSCSTTVTGMRWPWSGWSRLWKAGPELLHDAADSG